MRKIRVVLCCSGALGMVGLKALFKIPMLEVVAVMTDRHSEDVETLTRRRGVRIFVGNPRRIAPTTLPVFDLLLSVNYLHILPKGIIDKARLAALNVHGSLLPKYMGRTPATWVIINDEVETGITVHAMVSDVDCGPIFYQETIKISNQDTGGTLLSKMSARYPIILKKVVQDILKGTSTYTPQELDKRTYFGKREAADGLIDWRWSARKVYNWVRAQTRPYPGAFGYVNGRKYRFWWVEEIHSEAIRREAGSGFRVNGSFCIACGLGAVHAVKYELMEG